LVLSFIEDVRSEVDLAALVQTYATVLFRVAYSVLLSKAAAEDVVQDAFVRVLEHRSSLASVRDMRVWLGWYGLRGTWRSIGDGVSGRSNWMKILRGRWQEPVCRRMWQWMKLSVSSVC
jgi:hypothetical protein